MMKTKQARATIEAVGSVLTAGGFSPKEVAAVRDVLRGTRRVADMKQPQTVERPFTRQEVAGLLRRSVKTVDFLCRTGKLRRVFRRDAQRACGIDPSSVRIFAKGEVAK